MIDPSFDSELASAADTNYRRAHAWLLSRMVRRNVFFRVNNE